MRILFFLLICCISLTSFAGNVDTVTINSNAMHRNFKCVVIKPDNYKKIKAFPVVYLLHGYGGSYNNWIKRVPELKKYADDYQLMIVCPDGEISSWYLDSPLDSTHKYETYVGKEIPAFIDAHYKTIRNRNGRAITGLSMGGHGAMFIAFRNADQFSACGSMSGVMDLKFSSRSYDIAKRIGDTTNYKENWKKYSAIGVIENYPKDSLAIIIDCGLSDPFYGTNLNLHKKMLELKIPHEFTIRPGKHDWNYWANAVQYHLLFLSRHMRSVLKSGSK